MNNFYLVAGGVVGFLVFVFLNLLPAYYWNVNGEGEEFYQVYLDWRSGDYDPFYMGDWKDFVHVVIFGPPMAAMRVTELFGAHYYPQELDGEIEDDLTSNTVWRVLPVLMLLGLSAGGAHLTARVRPLAILCFVPVALVACWLGFLVVLYAVAMLFGMLLLLVYPGVASIILGFILIVVILAAVSVFKPR